MIRIYRDWCVILTNLATVSMILLSFVEGVLDVKWHTSRLVRRGIINMDEHIKDRIIENMTENLPTLRAKATLSQAKLAEMVGVSRQTLVAVENRKRKMSWSTFLACLLIFHKNEETDALLRLYEIYTEELNDYLVGAGTKCSDDQKHSI